MPLTSCLLAAVQPVEGELICVQYAGSSEPAIRAAPTHCQVGSKRKQEPMGTISSIFREENAAHALVRLVNTVLSRTFARLNGRLLRWSESSVPWGSKIVGTRFIHVESGFFASGRIWVEAVTNYEGQRFSPRISLGKNVRSSPNLHISAISNVTIGDDCLLGSNVLISDNAHGDYGPRGSLPSSSPATRPLVAKGGIKVGANCWIGDNVVILGGVEIGDGVVVAANSVVNKSIPPRSIAAGSPAKVVKRHTAATGWVAGPF